MDASQSVWEQELYNEIEYIKKDGLFHCFEGDTAFVGLSFMDDKEANHFNEKVQERIRKRKERAAAAAENISEGSNRPSIVVSSVDKSRNKPKPKKKEKKEKSSRSSWRMWGSGKSKKEGKPKMNKSMIGAPDTDTFQHVQGVKPSSKSGGFEMVQSNIDNLDPRIKDFMEMAGVDKKNWNAQKVEKWVEENDIYTLMDQVDPPKPSNKPPKTNSAPKRPPPQTGLLTSGGAPLQKY